MPLNSFRRKKEDRGGPSDVPQEKKKPDYGSSEWYVESILPAATQIWSMIDETVINVAVGVATPIEIKRAFEIPPDADVASYTHDARSLLELICMNFDIDPTTGEKLVQ